jgi:polysaccharide pyruvyl transferase WcaK-like protein
MRDIYIAITGASYSGNKGAAAMLQSSIEQLYEKYGEKLRVNLMSVWPEAEKKLVPWAFVKVVSAKAWKVVFIAFPFSVLFWLFRWCKPIKKLLLLNAILKTYNETDLVIDEAGVSFVDSRGFVMNTYAFISMAIPLLLGIPVVKYSQALGSFKRLPNRIQAKIILPKMKLICARGELTRLYLEGIGITQKVKLCADGAFTMEDNPNITELVEKVCQNDNFFNSKKIVGISPSSVVNKKCIKKHINYSKIMANFISELLKKGYQILIIANSARENSTKTRNNDLLICEEIYQRCPDKTNIRWYHKEMSPEEIREYIGKCRFIVASRFHAMIFALTKKVPVLLVGWSHKYQEVLDFFNLGKYATDFSKLSIQSLIEGFNKLVYSEDDIKKKLDENYEKVIESSYKNIKYISEILDGIKDNA